MTEVDLGTRLVWERGWSGNEVGLGSVFGLSIEHPSLGKENCSPPQLTSYLLRTLGVLALLADINT
ncbi:hypothetical protein [Bartonella sp. MU70NMGDW]|uniref:hypothetical protein n=1 Tax=Bartonella sp. MU70NMGDW TaxID=3243561 RepID=UPI0035CEEE5A